MAVNISAAGLNGRCSAYAASPAGQAKMNSVLTAKRQGGGLNEKTDAGSPLVTVAQMRAATNDFVAIIKKHAASAGLPASVMADVESFQISSFVENSDGSVSASLSMAADLSRESLQPQKYGGAFNIVALFNAGYSANARVKGYWETAGGEIWSKQSRDGLHFMQAAVSEFVSKYGAAYNVTVSLDGQY